MSAYLEESALKSSSTSIMCWFCEESRWPVFLRCPNLVWQHHQMLSWKNLLFTLMKKWLTKTSLFSKFLFQGWTQSKPVRSNCGGTLLIITSKPGINYGMPRASDKRALQRADTALRQNNQSAQHLQKSLICFFLT